MDIPVSIDDLLLLLGKQYLENQLLQRDLAEARAKLAELTPKGPSHDDESTDPPR